MSTMLRLNPIVWEAMLAERERLRAALKALVECDEKHEFTAYDSMHGNDEIRAVMKRARDALVSL
jgi:hypothetical protein